jgi:hypothetical protein
MRPNLAFIKLVHTAVAVDLGEGFGEVVGWRFGGGEGVAAGLGGLGQWPRAAGLGLIWRPRPAFWPGVGFGDDAKRNMERAVRPHAAFVCTS